MSDTTTSYVPYDYRRVCDVCGNLRNISRMRRDYGWTFCDYHTGERLKELLDSLVAKQEPFKILPVPNAKPLTNEPQILESAEAQIFNFVTQVAPASNAGGLPSANAAAWAGVYLSGIVNDSDRPRIWKDTAKIALQRCLTYLLTQQYGSPTGTAGTADNPRYGGIIDPGGLWATSITIPAGIAFLGGYVALGGEQFLAAAKRCATFFRHVQCGDLQATDYVVYPSGGSPYHLGGLATGVSNATGKLTGNYAIGSVAALWFMSELANLIGEGSTFGDASATAFFSAPTQATLTQMMSELSAFADVGPRDSASGGDNVSALSVTAPRQTYAAALSISGGAASWGSPSTVTTSQLALAMRGLYEADGNSDLLTGLVNWLQSFTANAANATPPTLTPQQVLNGITGTYDPVICVADTIVTSAPFTEATGTLYSWSTLGILAPLLAEVNRVALGTSRDVLSNPEPWSTFYLDGKYLGPLGLSGLSLQPNTSASASVTDVARAAQAGGIYRVSL